MSSTDELQTNLDSNRPLNRKTSEAACQKAADIFRALGEPTRFKMLALLMEEEMCVTDIANALDDNLPAVSQRLKLLRKDNIVTLRREGKFIYYSLADAHIKMLIQNALEHVSE